MTKAIVHGIIRGKNIELAEAPPFPDGEPVTVAICRQRAAGEGIRTSAGAWADAGEDFDHWIEDVYRARRSGRDTTFE